MIPLLAVALASIVAALIVMHLAALRFRRRRLHLSAAALGVLCALASGAFWSSPGTPAPALRLRGAGLE